MAERPIFIVAGNAEQARSWMRENGLTPDKARYVDTADRLRGVERGLQFVLVGTYYNRRDLYEIQCALRERQAQEVPRG